MSLEMILVPVLIFVSVAAMTSVALTPRNASLEARLEIYAISPHAADLTGRLARPLLERILAPLGARGVGLLRRVTPAGAAREIGERLAQAGYPLSMSAEVFLVGKFMLVSVVLASILLYVSRNGALGLVHGGLLIALIWAAFRAPDYWLNAQIDARREEIRQALPDALDLVVICVEAGLSFEAALARVVDRMRGPLTEEIRRTLGEMNMGRRRREALKLMAERCQTSEVTSFVAMVTHADQTGVSIGPVLRTHADGLRVARRQRAREAGAQAPLKMLFPMILFIFPATFAVVVGPAALRVIDSLAGRVSG